MMEDLVVSRRNFLIAGAAGVWTLTIGSSLAEAAKVPRSHGPATRRLVGAVTGERPGTILISNSTRTLDVVQNADTVARYRIGIGREGFTWTGSVTVGQKVEWPQWRPPAEMRQRQSELPDLVPPGPLNPLGARALYLYKNGNDTLFRIHGTNDAATIGGYVTSGCFRMTNADIMELYSKTPVGTRVIVSD
ncbi:lipoprotein-anchoring transpeptidase ErfK/SrfK [Aminobacter lissarensis]|uniref:Lipoprotein-anchoring transpeptidase ErfK/SrfK n=1 Tax=Aminobacter carboxidus TaxID=376165 RepID=A0A8E2BGK7_9HYPH|nr:L,D-transpeptidase [Aminobacter lissarensis]MBB6470392.1 lipoprotein-anchoring transpeptidase ErfK/SrfK [Aminobacter lissarensis]